MGVAKEDKRRHSAEGRTWVVCRQELHLLWCHVCTATSSTHATYRCCMHPYRCLTGPWLLSTVLPNPCDTRLFHLYCPHPVHASSQHTHHPRCYHPIHVASQPHWMYCPHPVHRPSYQYCCTSQSRACRAASCSVGRLGSSLCVASCLTSTNRRDRPAASARLLTEEATLPFC